ncbi:MAG: F0F1 ATP synthase subunit delta [Amnibacterium sp.]
MGAATRASTAAAVDTLDDLLKPGLLGRRRAGSDEVGGELLAAARAVASSPQLTNVLADVGVAGEQKVALVQRVFGRAYDKRAVQVLEALAASRWSEPGDVVDALEQLGVRAIALTADDVDIDGELFALERAVTSAPEAELALGNMAAPAAARVALVDRLLANAAEPTRVIVRHLVQLPRGRRIVESLQEAQRRVADARGGLVAVVTAARSLSDAQVTALEQRLATAYGRKIKVNQVIDPALIGGVRITIGDDVIDGTVRTRLDDLRLALAG